MLHIFFGPEDFEKERALAKLKEGMGDPQMLSLNTTVLDDHKITLDQIRAACDTMPFLSPQRLVILKGIIGRFERRPAAGGEVSVEKEEKDPKSEGWKVFAEYLQKIPEFTVVVLLDGQLNMSNPLLKALRPSARVVEFRFLSGAQIQSWIIAEVKRVGGEIAPGATRMLAEVIGNNLWVLSSEIAKLVSFALGRPVQEDDVLKCVSYAREGNIFAMVDAIIEKRQAGALRLLHQLLDEGAAPPYLLVMILRQYRLILQAKLLQSERISGHDMMSRLGITRDFVFEKTLQQAARYSLEAVESVYQKLLDLDVATKTGLAEGTIGMELLVAELTSPAPARQQSRF